MDFIVDTNYADEPYYKDEGCYEENDVDIPSANSLVHYTNVDTTNHLKIETEKFYNFDNRWNNLYYIEKFNLVFEDDSFYLTDSKLAKQMNTPKSSKTISSYQYLAPKKYFETNQNTNNSKDEHLLFTDSTVTLNLLTNNYFATTVKTCKLVHSDKLSESMEPSLSFMFNDISFKYEYFKLLPESVPPCVFLKRIVLKIIGSKNSQCNIGVLRRDLFSKKNRPSTIEWNRLIYLSCEKGLLRRIRKGSGYIINV